MIFLGPSDGTHLDIHVLVKAVHLIEQLQQDSLHLPVSCSGNTEQPIVCKDNMKETAAIENEMRTFGLKHTKACSSFRVHVLSLQTKPHVLTSSLSIKTLCCNSVNLIDEDDGRGVFLSQPEDVTHHPGAFTQILLHKLRAHDTDKGS